MPLVIAMMTMVLMVGLGSALTLVTVAETAIAANYRGGAEAIHAAHAAAEMVLGELATTNLNDVLTGGQRSTFVDGPPSGVRETAAGRLDLSELTSMVRCGRARDCSASEIAEANEWRPWGSNNPVWQLYAYGSLRNLLQVDSDMYVVVWIGDDPAECDGRPEVDGDPCESGANPGRDVAAILAHAYGPDGVRRAVELTVARPEAGLPRLLSWREVR